ncbi:hypothetical protein Tco_1554609 [Tanacetum coccineum]
MSPPPLHEPEIQNLDHSEESWHLDLLDIVPRKESKEKRKRSNAEEDLQAEEQASKKSKELQDLAGLEAAQRLQAIMDAETQRQIDLDALLARRLIQQEEREQYSIEERAKFLHDTIAAQRKFLAEQRNAAIRNKPPTISQLRNQMITYLKHVTNKKMLEFKSFFLTTKPQFDPTKPLEDDYMNRVTRSNGNMRFFRTLMGVLSIFDREDLKAVYELVMEEYQDEIPEGFDKMLWGDLMIMFNQGDTADFWDKQLNWKLISWKLHSFTQGYPLTKEVLSQMLDLKLETEEESTMSLELIKFVKQHS